MNRAYDVYPNKAGSLRSVLLKEAHEPLNLASLVNALAPWFYRTVWIQEHACEQGRQSWGGTVSLTRADAERLDPGPLVIQDVWDRTSALALARQTIEDYFCVQ
jgi:hypothetical protein